MIENKNFDKLTKKEQMYFRIMYGHYGVLYLTSKPGIAKSAITRSIAEKMGYQYMDIRLSMVDEVDVGLYPYLSDDKKDEVKVLSFAVPKWAMLANEKPTIIHFEELNRASLPVRNAALQLLLERCIGTEFKFNDDVLMVASGNLGQEDNTDVESFDAALNNRLIHVNHTLTIDEWVNGFARDKVYKPIIDFVTAHPECFYSVSVDSNTTAYATPRSWTMLSEFIINNYGYNVNVDTIMSVLEEISVYYIGKTALPFLRYCRENAELNINDILEDFDKCRSKLKKYNRDKLNELIVSFENKDMETLTKEQCDNMVKFVSILSDDEKTAVIYNLLNKITDRKYKKDTNGRINSEYIIKKFQTLIKELYDAQKKINMNGVK